MTGRQPTLCSAGMEAKKTLLVDKLARLAESNKEQVEKNNQLDKERKDEVARLTSENTKLKERVKGPCLVLVIE
jgi:hypothetical protein